jgi:hypothetical protein
MPIAEERQGEETKNQSVQWHALHTVIARFWQL